jgi:hypothetical protein
MAVVDIALYTPLVGAKYHLSTAKDKFTSERHRLRIIGVAE